MKEIFLLILNRCKGCWDSQMEVLVDTIFAFSLYLASRGWYTQFLHSPAHLLKLVTYMTLAVS